MSKRNVIVTGATSGIGNALVKLLLKDGHKVLGLGRREICSINSENFKYVSEDLNSSGSLDFKHHEWAGRFDTFIISHGLGLSGTLLSSNISTWSNLFQTNVVSTFELLRCISEYSLRSPDSLSDIVVLGSVAGVNVSEVNPVYGATKFALRSAVESLRKELCDSKIRVSVVDPGFVATEFQANSGYTDEMMSAIKDSCKIMLDPEEVASVIMSIISMPENVNISETIVRPTHQKA